MKKSDYLLMPGKNINLLVAKWIPDSHYDRTFTEAHVKAQEEGGRLLTLPEFAATLKNVVDGARARSDVVNGNGKLVHPTELDEILDEMAGIREEWRGEYIDAAITGKRLPPRLGGTKMYMASGHEVRDGVLVPRVVEEIRTGLLDDKRISFDHWIRNPTRQGFPRANVQEGEMAYWSPAETATKRSTKRRDTVFSVDEDKMDLDLSWPHEYQDSSVGFRLAFEVPK